MFVVGILLLREVMRDEKRFKKHSKQSVYKTNKSKTSGLSYEVIFLGQNMMERVSFKNSRGLNLVGHLYPSTTKAIIIMCHGFMSNKYSKGRFERLATAFNKYGYSALLFDFI